MDQSYFGYGCYCSGPSSTINQGGEWREQFKYLNPEGTPNRAELTKDGYVDLGIHERECVTDRSGTERCAASHAFRKFIPGYDRRCTKTISFPGMVTKDSHRTTMDYFGRPSQGESCQQRMGAYDW